MTYKLLSVNSDVKTVKGNAKGWLTGILYLAPHNLSGHQVCPHSTPLCRRACLYSAGRGKCFTIQQARIRKTKMFFEERKNFLTLLAHDINNLIRQAVKEDKFACVRLNGTSDIDWTKIDFQGGKNIMQFFWYIQFYDYTARPFDRNRLPLNYHLTFSQKENNQNFVDKMLRQKVNVAIVFGDKSFPEKFNGRKVINGDTSDLRFLEGYRGNYIGLAAKGKAKKSEARGFTV